MKTPASVWVRTWIFSALALVTASIVHAQAIYFASKSQVFFQNSSGGPVADSSQPFTFSVQSPTLVSLTPPSGSAVTVPFTANNQDYEINATFATKAALDAAYPNGTYRLSGTGIPTLSFNLATEFYPSVTPAVTGGTWSNGLLVIDPTQTATIAISTFSGYATSGVAGHMSTQVQGFSDSVNLKNQIATQAVGGQTPSSTPLTAITIPARTLTSGRVYQGSIQFDTLSTLDTTSLTGGGLAVALWSKSLNFYIVAQAPGTTIPVLALTSQPTNQTGVLGGRATFSVGYTVGGAAPNQNSNVVLMWAFNGQQLNIDGIKYTFNGGNLTVNNLTVADVGNYSVTLIAPGGIITSNAATLTLVTAAAPTIVRQPNSTNVTQGSTAVFSVGASASPAPSYQWSFNGAPIPSSVNASATGPLLVIQNVTATQVGNYSVTVSNSAGSATSNTVTLSAATNFNDPGRVINLSVLTDITATVPSFTLGTVVGGSGTSGNKPLVVRAGGPGLGALGVGGTIGDPKVDLFVGQTVVATNDNWGTPAYTGAASATDITTAMASVGAFAFPAGSKDAAIYGAAFGPNNYTVSVSGIAGATGTVIAEIYDATPAGTFTSVTPRLINVSVLKQVNTGGAITLGFTIGGSTAKTILIRAIGPALGLAPFNIGGVMIDPQLTLFNSSNTVIGTNDDWGGNPAIVNVGTRVNAFSIGNTPTKDSMLLVTLPPGGYTAQASGVGGVGGNVIVEAYEVP